MHQSIETIDEVLSHV